MKVGEATTDFEGAARRAALPRQVDKPAVPVVPAARQTTAAPPVEIRKIESVTRQIDSFLRSIDKSLQFRVDQATGEMIVTIRDDVTGEVIRQVPGEDALRIAQRIEDQLSALLDEKA
jgi:flagellar protein FlaG